jgi:hypothetical protein
MPPRAFTVKGTASVGIPISTDLSSGVSWGAYSLSELSTGGSRSIGVLSLRSVVESPRIEVGTFEATKLRDIGVERGRVRRDLSSDRSVEIDNVGVQIMLVLSEVSSNVVVVRPEFVLSVPEYVVDCFCPEVPSGGPVAFGCESRRFSFVPEKGPEFVEVVVNDGFKCFDGRSRAFSASFDKA